MLDELDTNISAFTVYFDRGFPYDGPETPGLAHLFEHLVVRDLESGRSSAGVRVDALTSPFGVSISVRHGEGALADAEGVIPGLLSLESLSVDDDAVLGEQRVIATENAIFAGSFRASGILDDLAAGLHDGLVLGAFESANTRIIGDVNRYRDGLHRRLGVQRFEIRSYRSTAEDTWRPFTGADLAGLSYVERPRFSVGAGLAIALSGDSQHKDAYQGRDVLRAWAEHRKRLHGSSEIGTGSCATPAGPFLFAYCDASEVGLNQLGECLSRPACRNNLTGILQDYVYSERAGQALSRTCTRDQDQFHEGARAGAQGKAEYAAAALGQLLDQRPSFEMGRCNGR